MKMYDDFRLFVAPGAGYAVYLPWGLFGGPSFLAARVLSLLLSFSSIVAVYLILARRGVRGGAGRRRRRLGDRERPVRPVEPQHVQQLRRGPGCCCFFLRAHGSARPRDHALVGGAAGAGVPDPADEGARPRRAAGVFTLLVLGVAGRSASAPAGKPVLAAGARRFAPLLALVGGFLLVVAPRAFVWSPVLLVREWFIVPFTGNYLASHERLARAGGRRRRWRRDHGLGRAAERADRTLQAAHPERRCAAEPSTRASAAAFAHAASRGQPRSAPRPARSRSPSSRDADASSGDAQTADQPQLRRRRHHRVLRCLCARPACARATS